MTSLNRAKMSWRNNISMWHAANRLRRLLYRHALKSLCRGHVLRTCLETHNNVTSEPASPFEQ